MKTKYEVTGLDCPNCSKKLATLLQKQEGITAALVNFLTEELTVESELSAPMLDALVQAAGRAMGSRVKINRK
ncbi:MAG: heavy metal-associated domain-containing protein [Eubacteriales bacterium]